MNLTADRLRHLLDYNPETGQLSWRSPTAHNVKRGQIAGNRHGGGYLHTMVERRRHQNHRLAWLHFYGEFPVGVVDHINGDKADNRISNLRLANRSTNAANSKARGSSGFKGVTACKKRWRAQITVNQEVIYLGLYKTKEEAHAVYAEAARQHFGEYARAA
jgi:hypothetical protein